MQDMVITVRKDELIKILKANRDKHGEVFAAALEGYRAHAEAVLRDYIADLEKGRVPEIRLHIARPEDHTRDYDRVIGMLTMHTGDMFDVDETTYAQYVDDDWSWKRQWVGLSASYAPDVTLANYGA